MATWGEILKELNASAQQSRGMPDFDGIRRKYLRQLHEQTRRATILYSAHFLPAVPPGAESSITVNDEDIQGFMEVVHGLGGNELDLIVHSPGGSAEATESIVRYLRQKFQHIRVIVPHLAMSAATMLACAANQVVMGRHSSLGPTDPQLLLPTPMGGMRMVPAQAIKAQFERARAECADQRNFPVWAPILPQYGPDLLETCDNVCKLTANLVEHWLQTYMFASQPETAGQRAKELADWLNEHRTLLTHGRHLSRDQLIDHGMAVISLEESAEFQDAVLSVFHATNHTFASTGTLKIIENHLGVAWVKSPAAPRMFMQPLLVPPGFAPPGIGPPGQQNVLPPGPP